MAKYQITDPKGDVYEVEAPEKKICLLIYRKILIQQMKL